MPAVLTSRRRRRRHVIHLYLATDTIAVYNVPSITASTLMAIASARKGEVNPMIVTIDGPAASGKSTAARLLAQKLNLPIARPGNLCTGWLGDNLKGQLLVPSYRTALHAPVYRQDLALIDEDSLA